MRSRGRFANIEDAPVNQRHLDFVATRSDGFRAGGAHLAKYAWYTPPAGMTSTTYKALGSYGLERKAIEDICADDHEDREQNESGVVHINNPY